MYYTSQLFSGYVKIQDFESTKGTCHTIQHYTCLSSDYLFRWHDYCFHLI